MSRERKRMKLDLGDAWKIDPAKLGLDGKRKVPPPTEPLISWQSSQRKTYDTVIAHMNFAGEDDVEINITIHERKPKVRCPLRCSNSIDVDACLRFLQRGEIAYVDQCCVCQEEKAACAMVCEGKHMICEKCLPKIS